MSDDRRKLTDAEIAAQRRGGQRIAPGIWADAAGDLHFSVPELLDHFGWPHDAEHIAMVEHVITESITKQFPGVPIVKQD
jgi:hypothetical protein